MENSTQVNLGQAALKNGLIWGLISIVIFLVSWYAMPNVMGATWYGVLTFAISILLAVYFCKDLRTKAGGYWSFSQALWPIFGMFILSIGISYVFTIAFGKFIDTSYPTTMKEIISEKTTEMFESLGMDESAIEEAQAKQAESLEKQFNPNFTQAVTGFGIVAVMYFIGALIFAAIFKRNDPNPWRDVIEEQNQVSE